MAIHEQYLKMRRRMKKEIEWYDFLIELLDIARRAYKAKREFVAKLRETKTGTEEQKNTRKRKLERAKLQLQMHLGNIDSIKEQIAELEARWKSAFPEYATPTLEQTSV